MRNQLRVCGYLVSSSAEDGTATETEAWKGRKDKALTPAVSWLRLPASSKRGPGIRLLSWMCVALLIIGCAPSPPRALDRDTLTSGTLRIVAEPEVADLVEATAAAFMAQYPEATIEVAERLSRPAMADVFADRADLAVVGREFETIERQAAQEGGLELEAQRWAWDGVAVVVHPANPVSQVSFDDLREVLSGQTVSWAELGGDDTRIVPVLPSPERGITQYVAQRLLDSLSFAPAETVPNDSAVIAAVGRQRGALGFASMSAIRPGVKALAVSSIKGLPYVELDAETVYRRDYPLTRSYNLVVRVPGRRLGAGFLTFAMSTPGQRLVRDRGLVPTIASVKFTRRLPTAPSH